MKEYIVVELSPQEYLVVKLHPETVGQVIASSHSLSIAIQIADALNPQPEQRLAWDDLNQIASQRGR